MNRTLTARRFGLLLLACGLFLLLACGEVTDTSPEDGAVASAPTRLPISLNEVMVALINHAADPIWVAAWHNPETDREWRELERLAYQLKLGGALLVIPGTGPMDDSWVANPEWREWSEKLRASGNAAIAAVESRDLDAISRAGDMIVEVCEGCHFDFKPDMPTGGKFGELSPTEADLENDE